MKKISDFIKNLNISSKFVVAYCIILILQVILSGIYLYNQASNSSIKQAKLVMEQNLMQTKASILEKEKVIENVSKVIYGNKKIRDFMEYEYANEADLLEQYQFNLSPTVADILKQNETVNSIKIYMPNAIVTEKLNSFYTINGSENPDLYANMIKIKPIENGWQSTHKTIDISSGVSTEVISLSEPIISSITFNNIWQLEIEVTESVLFDRLRDPVINKLGKVFVVDDNNSIISNNISTYYKKDISDLGIAGYTKNKKISDVIKVDNVKCILISIPINENGWSVVGIFPVSNFNSTVKDSVKNIIIVLLLTMIVLGIVIYLTTNVLLRRIKVLVKAMMEVRAGNLDVSVEVNSNDEFGELGLSFNLMTSRINDLVETVYKIQILEREAELKALEAQINPHFLYNTLATISWAARGEKTEKVVKITNSLAKFYRLVLSNGQTLISVKEELDIVVSYLFIQKMRFEDTLDVIYDLDESINDLKIIKNILQPVVENAVGHGVGDKRGHSTIIIKTKKLEDKICFKIIDDGVGMSKHKLEEVLSGSVSLTSGSGYAIKNIMKRLESYYGEEQSFEVFSKQGIGTVVTITVGARMMDKSND